MHCAFNKICFYSQIPDSLLSPLLPLLLLSYLLHHLLLSPLLSPPLLLLLLSSYSSPLTPPPLFPPPSPISTTSSSSSSSISLSPISASNILVKFHCGHDNLLWCTCGHKYTVCVCDFDAAVELSEDNELLPLSKSNPVSGGCECVCVCGEVGGCGWVTSLRRSCGVE